VSTVDVRLVAPGGFIDDASPIDVSQAADTSVGISAGDGGDVGDLMLANLPESTEFIAFVGDSIRVRVAAGATDNGNLVTGWLGDGVANARYEFSNLLAANQTLDGIAFFAFDGFGTSGNSGLANVVNLADFISRSGDTIVLELDQLVFSERFVGNESTGESGAYADFRIDLTITTSTEPPDPPTVPEPASTVLALSALLAMAWTRRRFVRRL
jgi:hypothetical protein